MNDLDSFCGSRSFDDDLTTPFSCEKYTYYCNGHILIRVPRIASVSRIVPTGLAEIHRNFDFSGRGEFVPLPEYDVPPPTMCTECSGDGKVSRCLECNGDGWLVFDSGYNHYTVECESCKGEGVCADGENMECTSCDGTGHQQEHIPVTVGGIKLSYLLLGKIKKLPGLLINLHVHDPGRYVTFRFDGGEGILMIMVEREAA